MTPEEWAWGLTQAYLEDCMMAKSTGDAATDALQRIAADMLAQGLGALKVGLEDDGQGGANITLVHVPWDRMLIKPGET